MSLNPDQVERIARLARIELSPAEAAQTRDRLNAILGLIANGHAAQRLREDVVTESDRRATYQAIAPEIEAGLYLVPKVIE